MDNMDVPEYMIEEIEDLEEDVLEEDPALRVQKRYIRDAQNPMEFYSDEDFRKRFRFRKDAVTDFVLPRISPHLEKGNRRGLPISPLVQLLITLRFYATGSFQIVIGDLNSVSQPTVSRVVQRVTSLLALEMREFICMPATAASKAATSAGFASLMKRPDHPDDSVIPNIEGAIDCCHVKLVSTTFGAVAEVYRNRKSVFSLNVQAVVGPRMQFMDIVPNWPGSAHDSRIFQNSRISYRLETGQLTCAILGDGGYRSLPYLFTPFQDPATPAEMRYNRAQKRGRNVVERTFGVWKRRFACLSKGLATKLMTSTSIVVACAVLHNMAIIVNDEWRDNEEDEDEPVPVDRPADNIADGLAARREIVRLYFERHNEAL